MNTRKLVRVSTLLCILGLPSFALVRANASIVFFNTDPDNWATITVTEEDKVTEEDQGWTTNYDSQGNVDPNTSTSYDYTFTVSDATYVGYQDVPPGGYFELDDSSSSTTFSGYSGDGITSESYDCETVTSSTTYS